MLVSPEQISKQTHLRDCKHSRASAVPAAVSLLRKCDNPTRTHVEEQQSEHARLPQGPQSARPPPAAVRKCDAPAHANEQ
jgi:hypothetical protein